MLAGHLSLQLVDLRMEHQVNGFMGCDYNIELFFRVLKQGCQIEPWRLHTEPRVLNAGAMDWISAWRLHQITLAGRASPEVPWAVVFAPRAWHTI
jgi:hypothetical protein